MTLVRMITHKRLEHRTVLAPLLNVFVGRLTHQRELAFHVSQTKRGAEPQLVSIRGTLVSAFRLRRVVLISWINWSVSRTIYLASSTTNPIAGHMP